MKYLVALSFLMVTFSLDTYAQPTIEWQKSLGGSGHDEASVILLTSDSGYIVAGYNASGDGDVSDNHGGRDCWVVKLDGNGALQWEKSLGGSGDDVAYSIQSTSDNGYILAGRSDSNDGDVSGNHGGEDFWIVKLNQSGILQWQKSLGGSDTDIAYSVQATSDGGYIIAGLSESDNGDVSGNHLLADAWVVKLDSNAVLQWQKSLGGYSVDIAFAIQQTDDGGYIVAGSSSSNEGDVSGNHGADDVWVVKLDQSGAVQWQKSLGGSYDEAAYSIISTTDGGYIAAGYTDSNDGDVSGHNGDSDCWLVKLDSFGALQWQKSLGGSDEEAGRSILPTNDGGYLLAGYSYSKDGDLTSNQGESDCWLVRLDSAGAIQWQKSLGGSGYDAARSVLPTSEGGYIAAGFSHSNDGDVSGNHGNLDCWVVKLNPITKTEDSPNTVEWRVFPNPTAGDFRVEIKSRVAENDVRLRLFDAQGRLVKEVETTINQGFNSVFFENLHLPKGIYQLNVQTERRWNGFAVVVQ